MTTEITMPQLGESVTEGTISRWLVKPGDKVNKYDPIAEVMTDKVNAEIPSSYTGTIKDLIVSVDETVEVGRVICTINVEETVPVASNTSVLDREPAALQPAEIGQKKRYSPAVLRIASEYNIDLALVRGTGRGGRITRKDLQLLLESGTILKESNSRLVQMKRDETVLNKDLQADQVPTAASIAREIEIPVAGVRKVIAAKMVKSKQEVPHAWTMVEVDVTNLVNLRKRLKDRFKQTEGFPLTFFPFFIKAVVEALKDFPQLNSMWTDDKIIQKKDIHISIAVATEDALYVPVIKHADEKTIKGLAREIHELAAKVRNKSITSSDMQDGTFTINNTGTFGSILSAPIINFPQAAILTVEAIVKRPVIIENEAIAIRHMVNLCLSLDHRVLDGLICGRFLARVKENLQSITIGNTPLY